MSASKEQDDRNWREYNIHGETPDECNYFDLFSNDNTEDEEISFELKSNNGDILIQLKLTGLQDFTNSTGVAVCGGAETLCKYLVKEKSVQDSLIRNQRILEMGAGLGVVGMTAAHLGASSVCITDGDVSVLQRLRKNIETNKSAWLNNGDSTSVVAPQLIWGTDVDEFRLRYGQFPVILAADCIYMVPSVEPFFRTVAVLLEKSPDATLIYCQDCASQATPEYVLQVANEHGLQVVSASPDSKIEFLRWKKL